MTKAGTLLFACGVLVGIALIDLVAGMIAGAIFPSLSLVALGTINGAMASLAAVLLLMRFGLWRVLNRRLSGSPWTWLWFLPLLVYALLPLSQGVSATGQEATVAVVFATLISFWKVSALIVAVYLLKAIGIGYGAIVAATVFGLTHLLAWFVGADPLATVANALASGMLGFHFAALYLRTGLSWPAILLYALLLFSVAITGGLNAPNMATSVEALLPAIVVSALLAAIGAIALLTRSRTPAFAPPAA